MKIITVQSIAGGTGVTAFALEMAEAARTSGQRVLLIDTKSSPGLGERTSNLHYPWVLDYRSLFDELREKEKPWLVCRSSAIIRMPIRPLYRGSVVHASSEPEGNIRSSLAPLHLRHNLDWLAPEFDVTIVDVENGNIAAMAMFGEVSDEIHLIERAPGATLAVWQEKVAAKLAVPLRARVIRHKDMCESLKELEEFAFEATWRQRRAADALQGIAPRYEVDDRSGFEDMRCVQ